jgi:mono/diheme cytochrome c family protein
LKPRNALIWGAILATAACSRDAWQRMPGPDDAVALVPWFANMSTDIAIRPYKMPLMPVEGTVPVNGLDPTFAPQLLAPSNSAELGRQYPNTVPRTAESIERGRELFGIYCSVCHGTQGQADGPMSTPMPFIPSIVTPQAQGYTDGYIYAMITSGRGLMPRYGDRVRGDDRWHLVNYLRVLQGTN